MNRVLTLMLVFALLVFGGAGTARAVFIELHSGEQIIAFLVDQNDSRITIQEATAAGGRGRHRHILRGDVKTILLAAEPDRLEALNPDNPKQYRNYAEEVAAAAQRDPEAREYAIRLYLIAAYLDRENLGKSSLLGMVNLARSVTEEKNFRALAYLVDPEHDPRVLRPAEPVVAAPTDINPVVKSKLERSLRALRRGNRDEARELAAPTVVQAALKQFAEILPYPEFEQALQTGDVSPDLLPKIVALELVLMGDSSDVDELRSTGPIEGTPNWSALVLDRKLEPVPSLALETITGFDPKECLYRDGKWVKPQ